MGIMAALEEWNFMTATNFSAQVSEIRTIRFAPLIKRKKKSFDGQFPVKS